MWWPSPTNPRHAYWTGVAVGIVIGFSLGLVWIPDFL